MPSRHSRSFRLRRSFLAMVLLAGVSVAPAADEGWPQFRGRNGTGDADGGGALDRPEVGLQVAWRVPLGSGYSGVVVAAGRAVTIYSDGTSDILAAFDARTGKRTWSLPLGAMYAGHDGSHDGPLSTPLIAGDVVIALGPRGRLVAVEAATGALRWEADLVADHGAEAPFYGFAASPILVPGAAALMLGAPDAAVAAFDLRTGKRTWAAGVDAVQYQSPVLLDRGGRQVLVAGGMSKLFGIDPSGGALLWEYAHEGAGGGYGASKLTPVPAGEGRLLLTHRDEASVMVRLSERDGVTTVEKLWEGPAIRSSYNIPVYHEGFLYAFSSRFLTCVDAATGEARWKSRPPGDGFLMRVDDRLVIVTKEGSLHVVAASPDGYDEVASLRVFEADLAWTAPAFADGGIFLRSLGELARVDVAGGRSVLATAPAAGSDIAGTGFGRFVDGLASAADPQRAVDDYLAGVPGFPIVEGDRVHFVYSGPAEDLALEAEMLGVAVSERMIPVKGTNLFYYSMRAEPDARAAYMFLRDYQEVLDPRNPRRAVTSVLGPDMELSFGGSTWEMSWFAMPGWKEPGYLGAAPEASRGQVVSREIDSKTLEGKLPLKIYLPVGYEGGERRYPVVYVHGDEALDQGAWANTLDHLIGKTIEPVIAVFLPGGRIPPPSYVPVFAGDVVPFVDGAYRTIPEPASRASAGAGLGGNFAFFTALGPPGLIGKVGTQSAFLFEFAWGPIQGMLRTAAEQPLQVYMDWGRYDLASPLENWSLRDSNRKAVEALRARGYAPAGGEANDGSGWASWRNRTGELLQALFPAR